MAKRFNAELRKILQNEGAVIFNNALKGKIIKEIITQTQKAAAHG